MLKDLKNLKTFSKSLHPFLSGEFQYTLETSLIFYSHLSKISSRFKHLPNSFARLISRTNQLCIANETKREVWRDFALASARKKRLVMLTFISLSLRNFFYYFNGPAGCISLRSAYSREIACQLQASDYVA